MTLVPSGGGQPRWWSSRLAGPGYMAR